MLTAQKNFLFEKLFAVYNNNLINRRFNSVRVKGMPKIKNRIVQIPIIIYVNHSSWWDGLIAFELSRKIKLESFFMMEERNLEKLSLFRKLGAFSVVRENPRDAVRSINYAVNILKEKPRRALWIFPQGEILPNDIRPFIFYNGISRIIGKLGQTQILPIAVRFEFLDNYKPDIFINIGSIQTYTAGENFDSKQTTKQLAVKLSDNLDDLKTAINAENFDSFEKII